MNKTIPKIPDKQAVYYYKDILKGKYGKILTKHHQLAGVLASKKIFTFDNAHNYIHDIKKYDNWSLRDLDKAYATLCRFFQLI